MWNSYLETTENLKWIRLLQIILGSISIVGSSFIILIFFLNLKKVTPAFELILQLSISSLINTASYLILFIYPDEKFNQMACKIQGSSMLFSELSLLIISTMISFYIWRSKAVFTSNDKFNCKERMIYLSINYFIPLTIALCCIESIGENGRWCWIDKKYGKSLALIEYLAGWILIMLNIIFACLTMKITNENLHREEIKNRKEYVRKLSRYPVISVICWLPATICRIVGLFEILNDTQYKIDFFFQILHIIFNSVQGFLFAIVSFSSIESGKNLKMVFFSFLSIFYNKNNIHDKPHDDLTEYLSGNDRITVVKSRANSYVGEEKQESHHNNRVLN
jgi:hypothetical protein